ncbi:MAG: P27 family phage terminase small subunit [Chloroflexota bacterium]|nr:P27 family phage terminase small subunit [Chloroflexota bacterium]
MIRKNPPEQLSERSRARWPGFVADLAAVSGAAELDVELLADVLAAEDRLAEVQAILSEFGLITLGSTGQPRPHPLLAIESVLRRDIAAGWERLGLTPNRRSSVRVTRAGRIVSD